MKLYDISVPISEAMPIWPGDPAVRLDQASSIPAGDSCNITHIAMGAHTGTHVDAPYHFWGNGTTIDAIPPEILIGPCTVIEVGTDTHIEKRDFESHHIEAQGRVLFKTKNSALWEKRPNDFHPDFIALSLDAAKYLVEKRISLVGIDYLSIEAFHSPGNPVHRLLLENNIVILEGLNLSAIKPGRFELVCLPLKLHGAEGSPARAVLREME